MLRYFAALCAELLTHRSAVAKSSPKRIATLHPDGTPSMAEVCRKLSLKRSTASCKFPVECKLIVSRYQRCRLILAAGLRWLHWDSDLRFATM